MGLFGFGTKKETTVFPWKQLTSIEQLKEIMAKSIDQPVLLFKHSTRCSISIMALSRFQKEWNQENKSIDLYYLDLLNHRDVSSKIAEITGVVHQSPQAILISNNEVKYTATHSSISARDIQKSIK